MNADPTFAAATVRDGGQRGVSYFDTEGNPNEIVLADNEEFVMGPYGENGEPRQPYIRSTDTEGNATYSAFSEFLAAKETGEVPKETVHGLGTLASEVEVAVDTIKDPMEAIHEKLQVPEKPDVTEKKQKAFNYEGKQPTVVDEKLHQKLAAGEDLGFNVRLISEETIRGVAGSMQKSIDGKGTIGSFLKGSSASHEGMGLRELDDIDQFRFARMVQTARSIGLVVENMRVTNSPGTLAEVRLPSEQDIEHLETTPYKVLPYNAKEQANGTGISVNREREHTIISAGYLAKYREMYEQNPQQFTKDMEELIIMAEGGEIKYPAPGANDSGRMSYLIQLAKGLGYELDSEIRYVPPTGNVVSGDYAVTVHGMKPGYSNDTSFMHEMRMRGQLPA